MKLGKCLPLDRCGVRPVMVPTKHPELLATPYGHLLNELRRSPENTIEFMKRIIQGALAVDTG